MCAGGLRTYLENHDALPDEPLVAMVPVSIRTGLEEEKWTNRVSGLLAALPTDEPDPLERIRLVHESMNEAKDLFMAVPAETLTDFTQFSPPAVFAQATRLADAAASRRAAQSRGQRDGVERAGPAQLALHGRRRVAALLPRLHDPRRPGPQHHGAELPRLARLGSRQLPRARARTCGTCSTTSSTNSP